MANWGDKVTAHGGRVFAVEELGNKNGRRHWHAMVADLLPSSLSLLLDSWRFSQGFVEYSEVRSAPSVETYVSKYILKTGDPDWIFKCAPTKI